MTPKAILRNLCFFVLACGGLSLTTTTSNKPQPYGLTVTDGVVTLSPELAAFEVSIVNETAIGISDDLAQLWKSKNIDASTVVSPVGLSIIHWVLMCDGSQVSLTGCAVNGCACTFEGIMFGCSSAVSCVCYTYCWCAGTAYCPLCI